LILSFVNKSDVVWYNDWTELEEGVLLNLAIEIIGWDLLLLKALFCLRESGINNIGIFL